MSTIPQIRCASSSGDTRIAYQVAGDGPVDLVYVSGFVSDVETVWEDPLLAPWYERMASFARVAVFDKRGQGGSDRPPEPPTLEQTMDDILAVMDAAGMERAALFGVLKGVPGEWRLYAAGA